MTYASQAQLIERFGEELLLNLTDRATPPAGAIDGDVVDRALADTDAVIDGYLAGRYQLPIVATPALLIDLALTIAIYKLHPYRPDEKIRDDYQQALKTLSQISTGTIKLDLAGTEPAVSGAGGVVTTDRERDLSPETLTGFI